MVRFPTQMDDPFDEPSRKCLVVVNHRSSNRTAITGGNMVSTVTLSTVMTVTTVAVASSLTLIGVMIIFTLLVQKEIAATARERWMRALDRALNVGIIPLLIAFLALVAMRIAEILK